MEEVEEGEAQSRRGVRQVGEGKESVKETEVGGEERGREEGGRRGAEERSRGGGGRRREHHRRMREGVCEMKGVGGTECSGGREERGS